MQTDLTLISIFQERKKENFPQISDLSWTSFGVKVKLPLWKYDGFVCSEECPVFD